MLFALEEQRHQALAEAARCAAHGDWPGVLDYATEAHSLRHGDDSLRWLALGHLLARDFARAWRYYRASAQPPSA
jgi:hypothetical protein